MHSGKSKVGRLELLAWINEILETDYPKVEMLCDGVGYAQILDAVQPKSIQIFKLNLNPKGENDNLRNLKLIEDCLHKLKFYHKMEPAKLSKGRFSDNVEFLQWLHQYANKTKPNLSSEYNGFDRRLAIYKRQHRIPEDESNFPLNILPHLIPNRPMNLEKFNTKSDLNGQRLAQLRDLVASLEQELTNQVMNYRLLQEDISQVEEERNFYFNKLRQIELLMQNEEAETASTIMEIISQTPEEFLRA